MKMMKKSLMRDMEGVAPGEMSRHYTAAAGVSVGRPAVSLAGDRITHAGANAEETRFEAAACERLLLPVHLALRQGSALAPLRRAGVGN